MSQFHESRSTHSCVLQSWQSSKPCTTSIFILNIHTLAKHIAQFTYVLYLLHSHRCKKRKKQRNPLKRNKSDKSRHKEKSQQCFINQQLTFTLCTCAHSMHQTVWHCLMHSLMCASEYFVMWNGSLLLYQKKRKKTWNKRCWAIIIYNFLDTEMNVKQCANTHGHNYCT